MRLARVLDAIARKPARTVIGLISGTSADAVDAAAVRVEGKDRARWVATLATASYPYPPEVRARVLALTAGGSTREVCELNVAVGELFAEAALRVMARVGEVDLIASHGQTVYHLPPGPGQPGATLQIGEPAVIAERTGTCTVAHFRARDMAAGGQGAPLVPYADFVLFADRARTRIAQNIGGIANATVLPAGAGPEEVLAFDTGPGNMVIDLLAEMLLGRALDADGQAAAQGTVDETLLGDLLWDEFIIAPPPKSTGRERYGRAYAEAVLARARRKDLSPHDVLATVTALTAEAIVLNYEQFIFPRHDVHEVIVSGGGVHNRTLMERLGRRLAPRAVRRASEFGVDDDAKEAVAFAILGHDALLGLATNIPRATGARRPVVLGAIYPPNPP